MLHAGVESRAGKAPTGRLMRGGTVSNIADQLVFNMAVVQQERHVAGIDRACRHCLPDGRIAWPCEARQRADAVVRRLQLEDGPGWIGGDDYR